MLKKSLTALRDETTQVACEMADKKIAEMLAFLADDPDLASLAESARAAATDASRRRIETLVQDGSDVDLVSTHAMNIGAHGAEAARAAIAQRLFAVVQAQAMVESAR